MSTSSNRLVKLSPTAASASRVPGDAPPGNGSRRRRYAASGKTLALSCLLSFVAWIPIASVQANERLDLLTASKQIEIASNDIQFEAAQATFFQLVVGTPCEKAVNDYLNMDFSIQLNVRLFTQGHMTFDQLKDAIKSLVDNYGRLEHVAEQIAWECGSKKAGLYALVDRMADLSLFTDEPERAASAIASYNHLS